MITRFDQNGFESVLGSNSWSGSHFQLSCILIRHLDTLSSSPISTLLGISRILSGTDYLFTVGATQFTVPVLVHDDVIALVNDIMIVPSGSDNSDVLNAIANVLVSLQTSFSAETDRVSYALNLLANRITELSQSHPDQGDLLDLLSEIRKITLETRTTGRGTAAISLVDLMRTVIK